MARTRLLRIARNLRNLLLLTASALLLLAGCGQRGDLYLPEKKPEQPPEQSQPAQSAPAGDQTQ